MEANRNSTRGNPGSIERMPSTRRRLAASLGAVPCGLESCEFAA